MSNELPVGPGQRRSQTAYVVMGGRVYPTDAREHVTPERQRGAEVLEDLSKRIRQHFVDNRFIMGTEGAEYTDNTTVLQDFQHDIAVIQKACEEVCDVLRSLLRLNTEFDFERQDDWLAEMDEQALEDDQYDFWTEGLKIDLVVGDFALTTRITTILHEKGVPGLKEERDRCLAEFLEQFYDLLDQMVDGEIVGVIDFGRDNDCDFHFFRDVVIQYEVERETMARVNEQRVRRMWKGELNTELIGEHFNLRRNESVTRRTRHEIYLREVRKSPFGQSHMPIPPEIHEFIDNLPPWLQEACQIIEGDRWSEQHFVCDKEHLGSWEEEVRPFHSVVDSVPKAGIAALAATASVPVVVATTLVVADPALTLGPYVLTGWDGSDVDEQNEDREAAWRERRKERDASVATSHSSAMVMAALISLAVAILGFNLLDGTVASIIGAFGATTFTASSVGWFHNSAQSLRKRANGFHYCLVAVLSCVFITLVLGGIHSVWSDNGSRLLLLLPALALVLCVLWLRGVLPQGQ